MKCIGDINAKQDFNFQFIYFEKLYFVCRLPKFVRLALIQVYSTLGGGGILFKSVSGCETYINDNKRPCDGKTDNSRWGI